MPATMAFIARSCGRATAVRRLPRARHRIRRLGGDKVADHSRRPPDAGALQGRGIGLRQLLRRRRSRFRRDGRSYRFRFGAHRRGPVLVLVLLLFRRPFRIARDRPAIGGQLLLELPRLQRPSPSIEKPRHLQCLVRRDLTLAKSAQRHVECRDDVAIVVLGHVEMDRPAPRLRRDQRHDEPRRHRIARQRLLDHHPRRRFPFAVAQCRHQHRLAIARPWRLPCRIPRLSRHEPPRRIPFDLARNRVHDERSR
jgi:hypothetical protein